MTEPNVGEWLLDYALIQPCCVSLEIQQKSHIKSSTNINTCM
jgi:hypothetical protein